MNAEDFIAKAAAIENEIDNKRYQYYGCGLKGCAEEVALTFVSCVISIWAKEFAMGEEVSGAELVDFIGTHMEKMVKNYDDTNR